MPPWTLAKNVPLDVRENCFNYKASGGDGKRLFAAMSDAAMSGRATQ
jgi:hypothetical protein